jgi:hypothetical protein
MNPTEQRLSELLHQLTPEPPNAISPDALSAGLPKPVASRHQGWRGWMPAAAAAAVVAIAVVSTGLVVASRDHQSPAPAGQQQPRPTTSASASTVVPPSVAASPSGQTAKTTCQTQSLKLDRTKSEGTAGSTYVTYYLTNIGSITCTMYGFPGVSFLDASGNVIQHPADRDGHANARFDVAPGQRAQFVVRTTDPSIPGTGCSPSWVSTQIQVYPPDQTTALRIPDTDRVCNLTVTATKRAS